MLIEASIPASMSSMEFVVALHEVFGPGWIFRGHRSADWELSTTLERYALGASLRDFERRSMAAFQARAHQFLSAQLVPVDQVEWCALMQHHGGPTRLLDWTYSPYVALFFALEEPSTSTDASHALWALHSSATENELSDRGPFWPGQGPSHHRRRGDGSVSLSEFDRLLAEDLAPGVRLVAPTREAGRLVNQQGVFLVATDLRLPFMANINAAAATRSDQKNFCKLLIDSYRRVDLLLFLEERLNISRATLFPDLDGFAASLKNVALSDSPDRTPHMLRSAVEVNAWARLFGKDVGTSA